MVKHKFIGRCKVGASALFTKLEKAKKCRALMAQQAKNLSLAISDEAGGQKLNEGYGDTMPSKKFQLANEVPNSSDVVVQDGEGDFGTVVVHCEEEINMKAMQVEYMRQPSVRIDVSSATMKDGKPELGTKSAEGVVASNMLVGDSPSITGTIKASTSLMTGSSKLSFNGIGLGDSTLKSDTLGRNATSLQDKLLSTYAAGNTVPIPFLKATDISPIALLSDNVIEGMRQEYSGNLAMDSAQVLFAADGQSKKGRKALNEMPLPPSVYKRLTSSSTLMNLAQALAYHKICHENMPLQELQAQQEMQTIQNLSDTIRTILRL